MVPLLGLPQWSEELIHEEDREIFAGLAFFVCGPCEDYDDAG